IAPYSLTYAAIMIFVALIIAVLICDSHRGIHLMTSTDMNNFKMKRNTDFILHFTLLLALSVENPVLIAF
ncbi:hypothetical protein PENTCL1PPCAC_10573, partial [Pristionchus entomophagus]